MLLTYERLEVAKRTLVSVAENLVASEPIWMHVADDGSSQEYRDELVALAHQYWGDNVSVSNSGRKGYGGNYNAATQIAHNYGDVMLPLEDDWELTRRFDVSPIVAALRGGAFSCVRMGYIGFTKPLIGVFVSAEGMLWLRLDPDSEERHVFAGGPRLETVEFERSVGPWPENMEQGLTEHEVAGRPEARVGVVWPVDLIHPRGDLFAHIGAVKAGTAVPGSARQAVGSE